MLPVGLDPTSSIIFQLTPYHSTATSSKYNSHSREMWDLLSFLWVDVERRLYEAVTTGNRDGPKSGAYMVLITAA